MPPLIPPPKFEKRIHHVVPQGWQRRFRGTDSNGNTEPGPYYKNILSGQCLGPIGPGNRMAKEYANIVFDEFYRPSDAVEDRLSVAETRGINALSNVIALSRIAPGDKVDLAYFLALQACRYPELYEQRLDLGRYLAVVLEDTSKFADVYALNNHLRISGMLPGASITQAEFARLSAASPAQRAAELDTILASHGYDAHFNIGLVLAGALPVGEHLLGLDWDLMAASAPTFILSDRPMPARNMGYNFSVGLSATLGLRLSKPAQPVDDRDIIARPAQQTEIDAVNREVRARASEWICGPGSWVHGL